MFKFIDGIKYKRCSKCGEFKLANTDTFSLCKKNKSGLKSRCKSCSSVSAGDADYYRNKHFNKDGLLKCGICNEFKDATEFHKSGTNKHRDFLS